MKRRDRGPLERLSTDSAVEMLYGCALARRLPALSTAPSAYRLFLLRAAPSAVGLFYVSSDVIWFFGYGWYAL